MTSKRKNDKESPKESLDLKKQKTTFTKDEVKSFFNKQIWDTEFQSQVQKDVAQSSPYKWGTIKPLIDDTLLRQVRREVLSEIAFTKKETDIYKVYQSGDLANLSGLDWDDLSRLPSLYKLRAAIYSQEFRDVVSKITGCGKLSGVKTDMSVNTYTKGCHLLTHDDVIGTRRVSFILYLPDPDKVWKPQYGGALRLFPSVVPNVPHTDYECKLVPQFNQIAFFTVQPGLSFHDVEEVREERHRLSIQGWFHIPQKGEDGYIEGEQEKVEALSTLQQLQSKELQEYDYPKCIPKSLVKDELDLLETCTSLDESDINILKKFLNPMYIKSETLKALCQVFIEESMVEIKDFFKPEFADTLKDLLRDEEINKHTPQKSTEVELPWQVSVPPHKQRFMYIEAGDNKGLTQSEESKEPETKSCTGFADAEKYLLEITEFLRSAAFKKWLKLITELVPTSESIVARRFRPGHDFILATTIEENVARTTEEENALLEATLNLTPTATNLKNWESGEFGGYELCMMQTIKSGKRNDKRNDIGEEKEEEGEEDEEEDDPAIYKAAKDGEDDSVLYTSQCKWNSLTLMVRDPSILKFVKYVSINAKGSRWDVSCQWNIKSIDDDNDENDEKEKNEEKQEEVEN